MGGRCSHVLKYKPSFNHILAMKGNLTTNIIPSHPSITRYQRCIVNFQSSPPKRGITPYATTRLVVFGIWVTGSYSCRYNVWVLFFLFFFLSRINTLKHRCEFLKIFCGILSSTQNNVMDLRNVMHTHNKMLNYKHKTYD